MGAGGQASGGYEIDQSIRFNADDSAFLTRTPGSEGDRRTFTLSTWVKFSEIRADNTVFSSWISSGASSYALLYMHSDFRVRFENDGTTKLKPSMVFGDTSAWYHIVLRVDTTDSTANDRYQMYVNGTRQTALEENDQPAQDFQTNVNKTQPHNFGRNGYSLAMIYSDLYQAETHFIDGTALTASSFGETNTDGVWVPKKYSGSYGNNGFFIDGRDSSDLGDDESGNGNDFSSSGLAAADQMLDTPTNNMPTLNPLSSGTGTLSDGNLQYVGVSGNWSNSRLTLLVPDTGKWAIRCKTTTSYDQMLIGLCAPDSASPYTDIDVNGVAQIRYNARDGNFVTRVGGSLVNDTGPATTSAQTFIQLLFDMDNGKMGIAADGATSGTFADISTYSALDLNGDLSAARQPFVQAYAGTDSGAGVIIDAGQSGWTTTVTGFKNLILANLDTPSIKDGSKYFQTTLYTGNGSTQSITQSENSQFQPDWVWGKGRSTAESHALFDAVRGTTKIIYSNLTNAEDTNSGVTAFNSNGFSIGSSASLNNNTETYVAWQWLANGSGSSNEDGSINTTATSANTTAGFSISTYTGTGANATVGHGLGAVPSFVIIKSRNDTHDWYVRTPALSGTEFILLNSSAAKGTSSPEVWNSTAPTSSVVNIGTSIGVNRSSYNYVMYCFAEIPGFSSVGSYVGNGSTNGPFVYTGFKPAFIIFKNISASSQNWEMFDNKRDGINDANRRLYSNTSEAEPAASDRVRLTSNGFKIVTSGGTHVNGSGNTIIYMAFAEHPFGGDGVTPATAR